MTQLSLLQPVTVDVGGPTASTLATALQATGAVMPSVACACARLDTKVLIVSSVSTGLHLYTSLSVHTDMRRHVTTHTRTLAYAFTRIHMYLSIPVHTCHTCTCQW